MGQKGMVMMELIAVLAVLAVLLGLTLYSIQSYYDHLDNAQAISDVRTFDHEIATFFLAKKQLPTSLAEIPNGSKLDPWGNNYQYLDIISNPTDPAIRKDSAGKATNTDYDLYSKGKDGASSASLTAAASQDDIVRANEGKFVGLVENY